MYRKWALVTGASSGIGKAAATLLAQAGYNLYLIARREERLEAFASELSASAGIGFMCKTHSLDVRSHGSILEFIRREKGRELQLVEILINSAGLARGIEKFQDGHTEDWDAMLDTNVKGLLWLTREIVPLMVQRRVGHIVNIGSAAGRWVYPGGSVYCASKFAVRAITEGLRMDLAGTGIRVTNIEPGMVNTEFSLVRLGDQEKADQVYLGMEPLSDADIAETIMWCLSRPRHVNIQEVVIFPTDQAAVGQVTRRT